MQLAGDGRPNMWKVTLALKPEEYAGYKVRNNWPIPINDFLFDEKTVIESETLEPFVANKKHPKIKGVLRLDPRLHFELIESTHEDTTETD